MAGSSIASTGIIIDKLREPSSEIQLTKDEESWFGKLLGY